MSRTRPRILVFAYAAEPDRGSEPGAGWELIQALHGFADCVVLVGPEHVSAIRRWEEGRADPSLRFVEVPEPVLAGNLRAHRILRFLAYLGWLRNAHRIGRQIMSEEPFDAVYHATYAVYWLPTPIVRFDLPSVWGPVGGAAKTPWRLLPLLGWQGLFEEVLDYVAVRLCALWPSTRRTWRSVGQIIVQNEETRLRLPPLLRKRAHVINHVMFLETRPLPERSRRAHILYVSPLETRKGPRLALRALAHTPGDVQLLLIGDGPERPALERLAARIGVRDRVQFLGRVSRERVFECLAEAAAVVFTGLREEGGMALGEALMTGVPVVVLANGGALTLASQASDPTRVALVPPGSVEATARRMGAAMTRFSRTPPTQRGPLLDPACAREALERIFVEELERASMLC